MAEQTKSKRYTTEEKQEVISWVNDYNNKNGRGGVAHAAKKFGPAPLSIASWVRKAGGNTGSKTKNSNPEADLYREIAKAVEQMASKRQELQALEAKVEQLKAKV